MLNKPQADYKKTSPPPSIGATAIGSAFQAGSDGIGNLEWQESSEGIYLKVTVTYRIDC